MFKWFKILLIKLKWVLFGGKPVKEVVTEINESKGLKVVHKKKKKISNGHYASTKRHSIKGCKIK